MGFFFLPKEKTKEISFRLIAGASLLSHVFGWITVFGVIFFSYVLMDLLMKDIPPDAGQPEGIIQFFALLLMIVSYPLSLVVAQYCKKKGFFAFGASCVAGSGIGLAISLTLSLFVFDFSSLTASGFLELFLTSMAGAGYGLLAATWFWIIVRRMHLEAFSSDWVLKNSRRRYLILLPFGLAFLFGFLFYLLAFQ